MQRIVSFFEIVQARSWRIIFALSPFFTIRNEV